MLSLICRRCYSSAPHLNKAKRFYKQVTVEPVSGGYEVQLDGRSVRTPKQQKMTFAQEALAVVVAGEWNQQTDEIRRDLMRVTGMCMTAQDNPIKQTESDLIEKQLDSLSGDTILYIDDKRERLRHMQSVEWAAVIDWLNQQYGTQIQQVQPDTDASRCADVSPECAGRLRQEYFARLTRLQLVAFDYGADALKSVLLMLAVAHRHIGVENAVHQALMEARYQAEVWGAVEYAHDMELYELVSRVSAAQLIIGIVDMNK